MMNTNAWLLLTLLAAAVVVSPASALPERSIVGGEDAEPGEFPYYVHVVCAFTSNDQRYYSLCGGSLIAPDIVLTAAHCKDCTKAQDGQSLIWVSAYEFLDFDIPDPNDTANTQRTAGVKWIKHPDWNDALTGPTRPLEELDADYALIKLVETIDIDQSSAVLELNDDNAFPADGSAVIAIGMGGTKPHDHSDPSFDIGFPEILQKTTMAIIDCPFSSAYAALEENMICVEADQGATCQGDSGGPVVVRTEQDDGTFVDTHIGIVSYGECNTDNYKGLARTSSNVEWIKETACNELNSVASFCNTNPPTVAPTESLVFTDPTSDPTLSPTMEPIANPTMEPVADPTMDPVVDPTMEPVADPTMEPVGSPTKAPKKPKKTRTAPTVAPIESLGFTDPTLSPTLSPTSDPTQIPTMKPTRAPTKAPKKTKIPKKIKTSKKSNKVTKKN